MKEYGADIDIRMMHESRLDGGVEVLLISLLAFMPLAFGARSAWSEEVVVALSGTIVICLPLKVLLNGDQVIIWTWASLPLILFVLIAVFQIIRLTETTICLQLRSQIKFAKALVEDRSEHLTLLAEQAKSPKKP